MIKGSLLMGLLSIKRFWQYASAVSRDLEVGVKNNHIFGIPDPELPSPYNFQGAAVMLKGSLLMQSLPKAFLAQCACAVSRDPI